MAISEELSKRDTQFSGAILLARIAASDGEPESGQQMLREILTQATDDRQRAELHYWLWKLDATDADHRSEALRLYESLFEKTPKHECRLRLQQLRVDPGTVVPPPSSARAAGDDLAE